MLHSLSWNSPTHSGSSHLHETNKRIPPAVPQAHKAEEHEYWWTSREYVWVTSNLCVCGMSECEGIRMYSKSINLSMCVRVVYVSIFMNVCPSVYMWDYMCINVCEYVFIRVCVCVWKSVWEGVWMRRARVEPTLRLGPLCLSDTE